MKVPSLRTRLAGWFAASLLLILAPFVAGFLVLQWNSMRALLDHHINEDLEVAAQMLVVRDGQIAWRTETEHDLGYDAGVKRWVEVFAADRRVLYVRGLPESSYIRQSMPAPERNAQGFQSIKTPAGARVRILTGERTVGGWPLLIRVARAEDELVTDLEWLLLVFVISMPLGVFLAAGAGYIVSGRMLHPLSDMAMQARTISAERLSERLPVDNPADELGQLAAVFNETFSRLEESFERLKRFSGDVSHELRTPLTAIRAVGEIGLRDQQDEAGYREIVGSMLEEADRLAHLVDELLMLSRWESGRIQPVRERLDLARLATEVADHLQVLAEERGVLVSLDVNGPLEVDADPTMIRQAVMNVLDNAIKYTAEHSSVRVWALSSDTHHRLAVDDEGPGISPEHRDRVAQRFYRVDDGRSRDAGGTGLGLSIADWALMVHKGRLEVDVNERGGARIWLILPRTTSDS